MSDGTAKQLLVLLLGGREQPALLTAAHLEPDAVLCIAPHTNNKPAAAARWLKRFLPHVEVLTAKEVAPYRPEETRAVILAAAGGAAFKLHISLTGAPMPMGIGGYEAAQALGCPAYYLDTGAGELLDLTGRRQTEVIPMRLGVREFALVNNVQVRDAAPPADWDSAQNRHKEARAALRADLRAAAALFNWLSGKKAAERFTKQHEWTLDAASGALLDALAACKVVARVERTEEDGKPQVRITVSDRADELFLTGFWLEQFVYEQACAARLPDGSPLFDDCAWGLHFDAHGKAHREVDFIGVRGGTGLIASCKAAKDPWVKNNLSELVSMGIPFGAEYLAKVYVTNQFRPLKGEQLYDKCNEFMDWAVRQNVTVVTGDDLLNLGPVLVQTATGSLRR